MTRKHTGCSIIFVNDRHEILLFLRDDLPGLPYANMWDIPGGHVETTETPEECIAREMKEEIELTLTDYALFRVYDFDDRTEYVFWSRQNIDIETTPLNEGQALGWFTREQTRGMTLAYGFNRVVSDFFKTAIPNV